MKKESILSVTLRYFGLVILGELIIAGIIWFIGRRGGWQTLDEYANALQIAGILAIGLGLFGIKGNWEATRGFEYQYSLSASEQNSLQRPQQILFDIAESYRFMC